YNYLRRRGFPQVRLPGLPWSPSFMAAYEAAMSGPRNVVGARRVKPGSVAAVVAEYVDSHAPESGHPICALMSTGSSKRGGRGLAPEILEPVRRKFGVAHGVLDVAMAEPGLQRPRVVAGVG